jgi:hypothetical protein
MAQAVPRIGLGMLRLCSGYSGALLGILGLCSGMLTLGSGKSGRCSRPETKTDWAKEKINPESRGIRHLNRENWLQSTLKNSRA